MENRTGLPEREPSSHEGPIRRKERCRCEGFPGAVERQLDPDGTATCANSASPDALPNPTAQTPDEDTLFDLTELFRMFADSTRVRILYALFDREMPVTGIAERLGMSQSAVSHQLRPLKSARLVKSRREGRTVFYSLADSHVITILGQGLDHVRE